MRTIGMLAIFVLALCAVGEGAYLFKLSREVKSLSRELKLERGEPGGDADEDSFALLRRTSRPSEPRTVRAAGDGAARVAAVPNFQVLAPPPTTPATATLREALATPEGRDQLKAALAVIEEDKRQERMAKRADKDIEKEQRWKERIVKGVPLTGDEPLRLETLFTTLQNGRRQILEEMKSGLKNAQQADDEVDALQENTEKSVRSLLGEERLKQLREAEKKERDREKQARRQQQQGGAVAAQAPR